MLLTCMLSLLVSAAPPVGSDSSNTVLKKNTLVLGLDYSSNTVRLGRTDAIAYPYLSPYASYETGIGLWISATAYKTLNLPQTINEFDGSLGYDYDIAKKWNGGVSYTHYYFNKSSAGVKSYLTNNISASLEHDGDVVQTTANFDLDFGKYRDVYLTLNNAHAFTWEDVLTRDNDYVEVEPMLSLVAGTNRYTAVIKNHGHHNHATSTSSFNLVDAELHVPFAYTIGRFTSRVEWIYAKPLNQPDGYTAPASYFQVSAFVTIGKQ